MDDIETVTVKVEDLQEDDPIVWRDGGRDIVDYTNRWYNVWGEDDIRIRFKNNRSDLWLKAGDTVEVEC